MKTKVIIRGVTGNWSKISLIPALNKIVNDYEIIQIIGTSRKETNAEEILNKSIGIENNISEIFSTMKVGTEVEEYVNLKNAIDLKDDEQLIIYLSVPAQDVPMIIELSKKTGFNKPNIKILIEKPFGVDLESAERLFSQLDDCFAEENVYKVDHYIVKTLMQNIGSYKNDFLNEWNNNFISSIEVFALETVDIAGRTWFYDETGCIRDMIQGHLMEMLLLCLCKTKHNDISERIELSSSFLQIRDEDVVKKQYIGYIDEIKETENTQSNTETYAKVNLKSTHRDWTGVNFSLISGKATAEKSTQIHVNFKDGSAIIFDVAKNKAFRINADGSSKEIIPYGALSSIPDASKGDFVAALLGRKEFFVTKDEIINSWRIFTYIVKKWNGKLGYYEKGSKYEELNTQK